jgi:hypothetical protein
MLKATGNSFDRKSTILHWQKIIQFGVVLVPSTHPGHLISASMPVYLLIHSSGAEKKTKVQPFALSFFAFH